MLDRRKFLQAGLATGAAATLSACSKMEMNKDSQNNNMPMASTFPLGIIYTRENPGKWAKKVGGHIPVVSVNGSNVKIETKHGMSRKHYIVRHTIVTQNGEVLAEKTFSPTDDEPISEFELHVEKGTTLYATSFCNKHDFWLSTFTV